MQPGGSQRGSGLGAAGAPLTAPFCARSHPSLQGTRCAVRAAKRPRPHRSAVQINVLLPRWAFCTQGIARGAELRSSSEPPREPQRPPPPSLRHGSCCAFGFGANRSQICPGLRAGRCQTGTAAGCRSAPRCRLRARPAAQCSATADLSGVQTQVQVLLSLWRGQSCPWLSRTRRFHAAPALLSRAALPRIGALRSRPGWGEEGGNCGAAAAGQSFTSSRGHRRGG